MITEIATVLEIKKDNKASYISSRIKGNLKCIILSASEPCMVKIFLQEYKDIVIFNKINYSGTKYLPLRAQPVNEDGEIFNYANTEWTLNNNLQIDIKGKEGIKLGVIIRYEKM